MELIGLFFGILLLFVAISVLLDLLEKPKAVKRIGKRRLFVKWNKK